MARRIFGPLAFPVIALAVVILAVACSERTTPTEPVASVAPTPIPTPAAATLGIVRVTLMPLSSGSNRAPASTSAVHTFIVHIEARETRGVGIYAQYDGLESPGLPYGSPDQESNILTIRIPAGGVGTTDVIVETSGDVPCTAGLTVYVKLRSDDGLTSRVPNVFGCGTAYWPL